MHHDRFPTIVGSLFILIVSVYFVWWIDRPEVRYVFNGNSLCYPQQMVRLPETVDFVAIGSSRVRRGLAADLAETASNGKITTAFNLGRPRRNTARSYTMLRDALEKNPNIKYAYVEIAIEYFFDDFPPEYVRFDVGTLRYADIVALYGANTNYPAFLRAQRVALNFMKKIESSLIAVLSGRLLKYYVEPGKKIDRVCWRPHFDTVRKEDQQDKDRMLAEAIENYNDYTSAVYEPEISFVHPRAIDELFYAEKIREIAAQNNVTLVFGKNWMVYHPPLSDEAVRTIQDRIPDYISPPPELVRDSWESFIDDKHMGPVARDAFTRWVVSELLSRGEAS